MAAFFFTFDPPVLPVNVVICSDEASKGECCTTVYVESACFIAMSCFSVHFFFLLRAQERLAMLNFQVLKKGLTEI